MSILINFKKNIKWSSIILLLLLIFLKKGLYFSLRKYAFIVLFLHEYYIHKDQKLLPYETNCGKSFAKYIFEINMRQYFEYII